MIPLFEHYPPLRDRLPYASLGGLPTPVQKLPRLGDELGLAHLYMKRDDLTGRVYGGNKIRKLEFILGSALQAGAREVLTVGLAGSKHALATAVAAQHLGLKSIAATLPQTDSPDVRHNLLMTYYCGAELHHHRNMQSLVLATICQLLRHKLKCGSLPRFIQGSKPSFLGTIAFVSAAFEVKEQVLNGEIPEPDRLYVACGTADTAVGLMLGLRAAKLKSRVISVRATHGKYATAREMARHFNRTNSCLHSLDPSFPEFAFSDKDIDIRHGFLGPSYGHLTEKAKEAVGRMEKSEGIKLEGTYTGKAFACLMDDAQRHNLRDEVLLFWNTYNSRELSDIVATVDYRALPQSFHRYFEANTRSRTEEQANA